MALFLLALWASRVIAHEGLHLTEGTNLVEGTTIITIVSSLPAFLSGLVAGLAAMRRPMLRRGLLVGFAALVAIGAATLYLFAMPRCGGDGIDVVAASCPETWKDALGAFAGAELAILFQAIVARLFAGVARKYPLRRPTA